MNFNFYDIIALVASSLSLLSCAIFIFINKTNSIPRVFLTLSIGGLGYGLFITTLLNTGLIEKLPFLYRTAMPAAFIIGPAIYYYITSSLIQPLVFPKKFLIHLIPLFLAFLANMPFMLRPNAEKVEIIRNRHSGEINMLWGTDGLISGGQMAVLLGIFSILYLLQSLRILVRNKNEIQRTDRSSYVWYLFFLSATSFIFLALVIFAELPGLSAYGTFTLIFSFLMVSLLIYLFTRPDILYGALIERIEEGKVKAFTIKTDESEDAFDQNAVNPELVEVYTAKIEYCLRKEMPFLRRDLRISDLSKQLDIPRHHLSWIVNNIYNLNFNDFINKNRLGYIESNFSKDEFKRMTLEGIAYDAGFNSRTTFTHAVKKFYNCTPSEHFKKNLN